MTDQEEPLDIQNTTDTGTPVAHRIATPAAARAIFTRLLTDDSQAGAKHRAIIQGMIDGNPPYRDSELKAMGLAHMINVNFLSMRANLDARAASGHELFAEVPTLIECRPLKVALNDPDIHHNCAIVAEEFTDMVTNWDGFLPAMDMAWRDSDAYGLGVGVWENKWDWRIKAFRRGALLVDPRASIEVDKNDVILIRDQMAVHDIFQLTESEDTARKAGWKIQTLKDLLVLVFKTGDEQNSDDKYQRSVWESLQQRARNNDPDYQSRQFDAVKIVHLLVREVAGEQKVTHLIIPETGTLDAFLYAGEGQYDKMSEAVWWMPYNYGDGYVRSVRGVASYMVQHADLSNRFLCRVFDAGFLTSSLLLQPATPMDMSRLQFLQMGPYTIVPSELNIRQSTFQPQLAPLLQLRAVSEAVMKNDTGTYRQHSESMDRDVQKTARQVVEESSKEARYEKAAIAARYIHLDKLYREMFRRVVKLLSIQESGEVYPGYTEAKEFLERCVQRGVPRKFIMDWVGNFRVAAYRSIGLGSLGVKYDLTAQIFQMSGAFDEVGKREALREAVAARVGYRHVDRFVQRLDRDQITSNETSIAMLEFNDAEEGSAIIAGSDQLHKAHIDVFAQRLAPILQAAQQGRMQDPVKDLRTSQIALQHISQHAQFLQTDPRYADYLKNQVGPFLQQAAQRVALIEQEAKRMMKAQQQAQAQQQELVNNAQQIQQDRALEAKILEINRKYELEAMKQQSLNSMRAQKTAEQVGINRAKAEQGMRLAEEEQAARLAREARETDARIALQRVQANQ